MRLGRNRNKSSDILDEPVFYDGVGAELRAFREARTLSIADVASLLRIQARYLEAIEEGDFAALPGPAYAVGFVQSYANLLGVDDGQAIAMYKAETSGQRKFQELDFPQPLDESQRTSPIFIILILVIVIGGFAGWIYLKRSGLLDPKLPPVNPPKAALEQQSKETQTGKAKDTGATANKVPEKAAIKSPIVDKKATETPNKINDPVNRVPKEKSKDTKTSDEKAVVAGNTANTAQKTADTSIDTSKGQTGKAGNATQFNDQKQEQQADAGSKVDRTQAVQQSDQQSSQRTIVNNDAATSAIVPSTKAVDATQQSNQDNKSSDDTTKKQNEVGKLATETIDKSVQANEKTEVEASKKEPIGVSEKSTQELITNTQTTTTNLRSTENVAQKKDETNSSQLKVGTGQPTENSAAKTSETGKATVVKPATVAALQNQDPVKKYGRTPQYFGAVNSNARVVIVAQKNAWIQVKTRKNELMLTRTLYPGDQYHAPNRRDVLLTVGSAGAIEIRIDGQVMPSLGELGVVRRNVPLWPETLRKLLQ